MSLKCKGANREKHMTAGLWCIIISLIFILIMYSILSGIKTDKQIKAIEDEYLRTHKPDTSWEESKAFQLPRERVPEPPKRVYRVPADPIDAIDPENPTAPSLRDEYKQMIRSRKVASGY